MRHSIISWDCCYRNFFHTAVSLAEQAFDIDSFEVLYVEQRTEAASDRFNHELGLASLGDLGRALRDRMHMRVLYLGDGTNTPLHWGRAVNLGIQASRGEVISVMDGDLLVDRDFLARLDDEHQQSANAIVNLHRRMVPEPIGVPRDRWIDQSVTFDACLNACPDRDQPLPSSVQNYGPMISSRRKHWDAIQGYDEHRIWSTGLSRIGEDVCKRLEIYLDVRGSLLPDKVCVHPWHPVGFRRDTFAARRMLALQGELIEWARINQASDWKHRQSITDALYRRNHRFVDRVAKSDVADPSTTPTRFKQIGPWLSGMTARLLNREFRQVRGELSGAVRNMLSRRR